MKKRALPTAVDQESVETRTSSASSSTMKKRHKTKLCSQQEEVAPVLFQKHQHYMEQYLSCSESKSKSISKTDVEILSEYHEFVREEDEETSLERSSSSWMKRMSVQYYNQLFKEYALIDLSRYKSGQYGLRWRTRQEVIDGKGQFICGNKRGCDQTSDLASYELLFGYVERAEKKKCMVKVRICPSCAMQLFYQKIQTFEKHKKRKLNQTIHEFVQECIGVTNRSGDDDAVMKKKQPSKSAKALLYEELLL